MKKMIFTIAMGVLCMCVTSCSDICKDAYMAEQAYKLCREKGWADSTLYKNEFIEMYQSMTYKEQQRYKSYREKMDAELREQAAVEDFARMEALKMLSE
jgi:hypothetical protein